MSDYIGVIIEESLEDKKVLQKVKILKTRIAQVTEKHKTPWIKQWTLHTVEIPENQADAISKELSKSLDSKHNWYADFKNDKIHYIIFRDRVFRIDRTSKEQYDKATAYGISIGIPNYQVNFSPHIKNGGGNSMKFSYKIHRSGSDALLAICDDSILGKSFENSENEITINPEFYHEEFADEKTILKRIKEATIVNAIGKETVELLLKNKIAQKSEIINVCGLPHAMIVSI